MPESISEPPVRLRDVARSSVRDHLKDQAVRLFDERGFDATTVDDIAAAVGMSSRTFFRYFATKEDVVIEDPAPFGAIVRDAAARRPDDENPWTVLRRALDAVADRSADATEAWVRSMRVMMSTASLRARNTEKHNAWALMLEPVITARLDGPADTRPFRARTLIHASLACLDAALAEWTRLDGAVSLGTLLDTAFDAVSRN